VQKQNKNIDKYKNIMGCYKFMDSRDLVISRMDFVCTVRNLISIFLIPSPFTFLVAADGCAK
jgi:hypothetical protein